MTSGDIHSPWANVKLADVLHRVRKPVQLEPDMLYREIGIRSHGKGLFYKEARTGKSLGDKSVFWIEPDCFVVNIVFAWEQAVAKTTQHELGMIASHRFPMYRPAPEKLDLDYLVYFFKSPLGKYRLGLASPGGAGRNKTLGQQEFFRLTLPLPSLSEQRKIVEILGAWENAIALTEQLIAAKQQRKQGLMQLLLTGKQRFQEFREGWNRQQLGELLNMQYGKSPKGIRNDVGEFLILGTGGIVGKTNTPLSLGPAVIIGRKGTLTQPQFIAEPFWAIDTTFYCAPKQNVDMKWVYYALSWLNLERYNEGSTIPSLSRTTLNDIELLVPAMDEQHKIASILGTCDTELDLLSQKLAALKQQKTDLMQQLLMGRVRVKTEQINC